jgi:hypothetical protein
MPTSSRRSAARAAPPEILPPPADMAPLSWIRWFRAEIDKLSPALGRPKAEQEVYVFGLAELRRRDRRKPSLVTCAGCQEPIVSDADRLVLQGGVAVHASRPSCRSDAAFRRLRADRTQLVGLGIVPPKGSR